MSRRLSSTLGILFLVLSHAFHCSFNAGFRAVRLHAGGNSDELSALKLDELKNLCRSQGLKVSGTKAVLIDRLVSAPASSLHPTPNHSYKRASDDELKLPIAQSQLDGLIAKREAARLAKNFAAADDLRVELDKMGIGVSDSSKTWFVTPPSEVVQSEPSKEARVTKQKQGKSKRQSYERAQDDLTDLAPDSMEAVAEILRRRSKVRAAKDFAAADELLSELLHRFGVTVLDGAMEWRADGKAFAASEGIGRYARSDDDLSDLDSIWGEGSLREVIELVTKRSEAKKNRDYSVTDELRALLRLRFGVEVDDIR